MLLQRYRSITLLVLATAAIVVLAVGLPGMQLQAGLPIPGAETAALPESEPVTGPVKPNNPPLGWVVQGVLAVGFIVLLALLLVGLLRKAGARRLLQLATAAIVALALLLLLPRTTILPTAPPPGDSLPESQAQIEAQIAPIGDPPEALVHFVVGLLALLAAVAVAWLVREWLRKPEPESPLARATAAALQALEDGQDLNNVIIRCYLNMVMALKEERGIERKESVTPREFEAWLAGHGVPDAPTRQLTRLFEKARYGSKTPGPHDEQAAVECLSAIQAYCRQDAARKAAKA